MRRKIWKLWRGNLWGFSWINKSYTPKIDKDKFIAPAAMLEAYLKQWQRDIDNARWILCGSEN